MQFNYSMSIPQARMLFDVLEGDTWDDFAEILDNAQGNTTSDDPATILITITGE